MALVNVAGALLGLAVTAIVARLLGPERLGVAAVVTGVNVSIMAFLDLRVGDLAGKLYTAVGDQTGSSASAYRAGVLLTSAGASLAINLGTALLAAVAGNQLVSLFLSQAIPSWWLPLDAMSLAFNATAGALFFLMRFSGEFRTIGTWRFFSAIVSSTFTVATLMLRSDLSGYFLAEVVGAISMLMMAVIASLRLWRRMGLSLMKPDLRGAYEAMRQNARLLWYGNLLGYAKLLQRSADVLLVASFCSERETGLYRLARQIIDRGLAVLQEAIYEVNYPRLLQALARGVPNEFTSLSIRLMKLSAVITLGLVVAEFLLLPLLVPILFGEAFAPAVPAMILLTSTFLAIIGFYPWLWAIFVHAGRLRGFAVASFVAVGAHYGLVSLLFASGERSASSAMLGHLAYYLVLITAACVLARRMRPAIFPQFGGVPS